jgi:hypothetical protein
MTNPTLKQFVETMYFDENATGFPQNDTYLDLESTVVEKFDYKEQDGSTKTKYKLHIMNPDGSKTVIIAPLMVYKMIQAVVKKDPAFKRVRVTRTGTGKTDTRYTVVGVNS